MSLLSSTLHTLAAFLLSHLLRPPTRGPGDGVVIRIFANLTVLYSSIWHTNKVSAPGRDS
jgi:hypothetical protein